MMLLRLRLLVKCTRHCSTIKGPSKEWSTTVLTPKTTFPLKVEGEKRVKLDEAIIASASFKSVYERQMSAHDKPLWILHDGPPYANGPAHIGHAVNKILKDIVNRSKVLSGHRAHFVPGWDCHGLPIELKALSKAKVKSRNDNALEIRKLSRAFALEAMDRQRSEFISWGVMGNWKNPYLTMSKDLVKAQLVAFNNLYKQGHIYERFMPVYWSPSSQTALAESELEYNAEHVSTAIYVRFLVVDETVPSALRSDKKNLYLLSWTTTPWSLVANKAIAYKRDAQYAMVESHQGDKYIMAKDLLFKNEELKKLFDSMPIIDVSIEHLKQMKYRHPMDDAQIMKLFPGSHVTLNAGTGLVHTAPAHGQEDFLLGIDNNLDLSCPVDEMGRYDHTVQDPTLRGLEVLGLGNQKVLEILHAKEHILKQSEFVHSYPYDWRTNKPVILRGSKQWFMDTKSLQPLALKALGSISCNMNQGFESILKSRPYWCISRQRVWGVPIPMFYDESRGTSVTSDCLVEKLCRLTEQHGNIDFWWQMSEAEILSGTDLQQQGLVKSKDILDVWFDSGITWHGVIPGKDGAKVADLYLEGLDQFSGWFYSSLLTSLGAQKMSPYKQLFVHGFAMDENGRKMSKSIGNVVAPSEVTRGLMDNGRKSSKFQSMGVDVLRYWVGAHASQSPAIEIGVNILQSSKMDVDRIRSAIRFIIGNLEPDAVDVANYDDMRAVDKFILHQLYCYVAKVNAHFDELLLNKVSLVTQNFIANDLSGFYFTLLKDRLYCEPKRSPQRLSAVSALFWIGLYLTKSLSPILPLLAHEVGEYCPAMQIDLAETLTSKPEWKNDALAEAIRPILEIRRQLNKVKVKKSDQVRISDNLPFHPDDLAEIWQVAQVQVEPQLTHNALELNLDNNKSILVSISESSLHKCPRCRVFKSVQENKICQRCQSVIETLN